MDLLSPIRRFIRRTGDAIVTTLTTPVGDNTPAALRPVLHQSEAEIARQKAILMARRYHDGLHDVRLTDRLKDFLGQDSGPFAVRLNFIQRVNRGIAERLIIERFDSTADGDQKSAQIEMADRVWAGSRMQGKRKTILETVTDGEHFLIVDYDKENKRARWTPWPRYTDPTVTTGLYPGNGEGAYMVYPNEDENQKPLYGVQRWTEHYSPTSQEERITLYFPDRIERYARKPTGWQLAELPREGADPLPETSPWVGKDGQPLGIAMVHVKTPENTPAAIEAIPLQKALNKTFVDMMIVSDYAFKMYITYGWFMTEDGTATGTPLAIGPGTTPGTSKTKTEAGTDIVEGADPSPQLAIIDRITAQMADVTNTPLSLIQRSAQRAAEGTLQEEKESFIAKVRDYAESMEMAYGDAFKLARRLENEFGAGGLDVDADGGPDFKIIWRDFTTRSIADKEAESRAMIAAGMPLEVIWRDVFDKSEAEIEDMKSKRQNSRFSEMRPAPALSTPPVANGATPNG